MSAVAAEEVIRVRSTSNLVTSAVYVDTVLNQHAYSSSLPSGREQMPARSAGCESHLSIVGFSDIYPKKRPDVSTFSTSSISRIAKLIELLLLLLNVPLSVYCDGHFVSLIVI